MTAPFPGMRYRVRELFEQFLYERVADVGVMPSTYVFSVSDADKAVDVRVTREEIRRQKPEVNASNKFAMLDAARSLARVKAHADLK